MCVYQNLCTWKCLIEVCILLKYDYFEACMLLNVLTLKYAYFEVLFKVCILQKKCPDFKVCLLWSTLRSMDTLTYIHFKFCRSWSTHVCTKYLVHVQGVTFFFARVHSWIGDGQSTVWVLKTHTVLCGSGAKCFFLWALTICWTVMELKNCVISGGYLSKCLLHWPCRDSVKNWPSQEYFSKWWVIYEACTMWIECI